MKYTNIVLKIIVFCLLSVAAAFAQPIIGTWVTDRDAETKAVSITTEAIEGQSCRETPATLTISCVAEVLTVIVGSGCSADKWPRSNPLGYETDVLVTFEFVGGASVLFDDSSMYPFETDAGGRVLHLGIDSRDRFLTRMLRKPTFATSIDLDGDDAALDANGQFARMTSHFDTSMLAATLKASDMQCGIQELLE